MIQLPPPEPFVKVVYDHEINPWVPFLPDPHHVMCEIVAWVRNKPTGQYTLKLRPMTQGELARMS